MDIKQCLKKIDGWLDGHKKKQKDGWRDRNMDG